jgi:ATP phosphoribosyltransferase-like protein|mmetsp:Transcript_9912/g.25291  ORF Transcript_9912/g.25291 Transcript_9912/m.25291 type:complete len:103 (+) Transcript_9912:114-422(+)
MLIANTHTKHIDIIHLIKRRLEGYITATKYVMLVYNVSNELVERAVAITPGKRSPTITALDDGNSKAVSSLVLAKEVNQKMDALHDIGATDILVLDISNSRM